MAVVSRIGWRTRVATALGLALAFTVALPTLALANVNLTQISSDPFTAATCTASNTTYHHTEVEPDTFSNGSTIVATFQVGRVFDGGSCDIGFATSTTNGASWTNGLLPGITKFQGGGPYDRVSDSSVAFDPKHGTGQGVWIISSLPLLEGDGEGVTGAAVVVSRSLDGGLTWSNPVTITTGSDLDKNWTVCDTTSTSAFFGNCYTEWDDHAAGNTVQMSTSTDGGLTWGPVKTTTPPAGVIGGQPLVQPNGTVIVPIDNATETAIGAFTSTNGGGSWSAMTTISTISFHTVAGGLRAGALPTAEIDGAGKVYVVWADCRFESGCTANDLVMSTSTNGTTWTAVTRIPIDAVGSNIDHFIPGLAVNKATSGGSAQLGLTYYYYTAANCSSCSLNVGFISSANGGSTWSAATAITGPFPVGWVADTSQGRMVGDYISTSYGSDNLAHAAFATAGTPTSGTNCGDVQDNCNEPMDTTASGLALGLALVGGSNSSAGDPVLFGSNGGSGAGLWNVAQGNTGKHHH